MISGGVKLKSEPVWRHDVYKITRTQNDVTFVLTTPEIPWLCDKNIDFGTTIN
jgi:hypothetical protein